MLDILQLDLKVLIAACHLTLVLMIFGAWFNVGLILK